MHSCAVLNERQRHYMQAVYETEQEQEADERAAWKRGGRPRPASVWRWMEYGVIDGIGSTLYMKLYLRKLVDEGTGSTFNALEARRFVKCKYTYKRRDGDRMALERFLMLQITKEGRALVRSATGAKAYRPGAPETLREWHWKAMVEAWNARPAGVESENGYYGHIGWNTWLRLRDFKAGSLVEEYRTSGPYLAHVGYSTDIHWIRLTPFGEQFYRDNWQQYCELYPEVNAPAPEIGLRDKEQTNEYDIS